MIPAHVLQWMPAISTACAQFGLSRHAALVAAIMEVESQGGRALDPQGPDGVGDHGHGRGLMQVDDRWHAQFIGRVNADGASLWQLPLENIRYAVGSVFKPELDFFDKYIAPDSIHDKAKRADAVLACAIAAYNAGRGPVLEAYNNPTKPTDYEAILDAVDTVTTGRNYVSRVLNTLERFLSPQPKGVS